MDSDAPIGFMIHGYSKDDAELINEFLETIAERKMIQISATGQEEHHVANILDSPSFSEFAVSNPKILMFLGFSNEQIGPAMKHFPGGIERPIFCSPTEQNLQWTLEYLIEHLLEERAAMTQK